jgi:hypothetical protein
VSAADAAAGEEDDQVRGAYDAGVWDVVPCLRGLAMEWVGRDELGAQTVAALQDSLARSGEAPAQQAEVPTRPEPEVVPEPVGKHHRAD